MGYYKGTKRLPRKLKKKYKHLYDTAKHLEIGMDNLRWRILYEKNPKQCIKILLDENNRDKI